MKRLQRILVSNTTEKQLSWLVGIADGRDWSCDCMYNPIYNFNDEYIHDGGDYANNWNLGGPIIEREKISLEHKHDGWWVASYQYNYSDEKEYLMLDHSPLVAAMRCFVVSRLGESVEIPEELK